MSPWFVLLSLVLFLRGVFLKGGWNEFLDFLEAIYVCTVLIGDSHLNRNDEVVGNNDGIGGGEIFGRRLFPSTRWDFEISLVSSEAAKRLRIRASV
ncbi:hypothetical protein EDB86DRAFT_2883320 [Lactarius hatsudake]|nr:hypothetical protein EDB86DRAFT_2883320 [Lactarius hatsudake]